VIRRLRAFRVEDDLWDRAINKSQIEGITVSEILRDALEKYLKSNKHRKRAGK
jgi:predicted DNA-binding protein